MRKLSRPVETFARTLPPWVAVELRPRLPTCGCVQTVSGRAYAAGACGACHGAGVTFVAPLTLAGRAA